MDVYVGIEGVNISSSTGIPINELKVGQQFKLTLNIKKSKDVPNQPKSQNNNLDEHLNIKSETNGNHVPESQNIAVSLPNLVTGSQLNHAIKGVIEPLKKER
jgi:hypothetical protein